MDDPVLMEQIRLVKAKYEKGLLKKRNVVGVGVGFRQKGGQFTDQVVLTVLVRQKQPLSELRQRDIIPSELDGVPVDVQQAGTFRA